MTSPGNALLHAITEEAYKRTYQKLRATRGQRELTRGEKATIHSAWCNGRTKTELAKIYGVSIKTISKTIDQQLKGGSTHGHGRAG